MNWVSPFSVQSGLVGTLIVSSLCVSCDALRSMVLFSICYLPSSVLSRRHRPLPSRRVRLVAREGHNSNSHMNELIVTNQKRQCEARTRVSCVCAAKGTNLSWGWRLGSGWRGHPLGQGLECELLGAERARSIQRKHHMQRPWGGKGA